MEQRLNYDASASLASSDRTRRKGLVWGLAGGVVATIAIDLVTMAVLPLMGAPADSGFIVIGDTAAGFLALLGIDVAGGVPLGLALHYVIGLALGGLFGVAVTRIPAFWLSSLKKGVGLGILYAEIISLPIVLMPPIVLQLGGPEAARWFGFCLVMHAIWGAVLGALVAYGLRSTRQEGA